jgi:hypothetical protein
MKPRRATPTDGKRRMSQNHTTNAAAIMRKNKVLDGPIHTQRVKNVTADTRRRSTGGLAGGFVERGDLPDFAVMRAAKRC